MKITAGMFVAHEKGDIIMFVMLLNKGRPTALVQNMHTKLNMNVPVIELRPFWLQLGSILLVKTPGWGTVKCAIGSIQYEGELGRLKIYSDDLMKIHNDNWMYYSDLKYLVDCYHK